MPQKPGQLGRVSGGSGEAARAGARVEAATAGGGNERSGTGGLMELVCERQNLTGRAEACEGQQGQSRHRRDDGRGAASLPQGALVAPARGASRGALPAAACEAGGDPQARRRRARARHPDRARPVHPAGPVAGPAAAVRSNLLRCKLRLPAGPTCARRRASRARLRAGWPSLRRGHRPGEVLRSGEPRRADGTVGASGSRTAACWGSFAATSRRACSPTGW